MKLMIRLSTQKENITFLQDVTLEAVSENQGVESARDTFKRNLFRGANKRDFKIAKIKRLD